jgi:acetyl esterase/lipase
VERIADVPYYSGADAKDRHTVDLFVPKGRTGYPVVVLVHGGAWIMGDNRCCGLFASVGEFLASQGIGAVLPNYRLSPGVKHPAHVRDVARAFAWAKNHISEYGGDPTRMFLVGHSAGGHLVALLGTDESYLKAEGCSHADVKGVVGVSGVYRIPEGKLELTMDGPPPRAMRLDQIVPLRGNGDEPKPPLMPGIPVKINIFGPAFGDDPRLRESASPVNHVRPGLPPFLLFYAEKDLPTLEGSATEFHRALADRGGEARLFEVRARNHNSILFDAVRPDDPVAEKMVDFIRRHSSLQEPVSSGNIGLRR